jgi:hypothetical protein
VTVPVDVKPGSCPNPFSPRNHGMLTVAVLGTEDVDGGAVDPTTIILSRVDGVGGSVGPHEGPPGPRSVMKDVATPGQADGCACHPMVGDGIDDWFLYFDADELVEALQLDNVAHGTMIPVHVQGALFDGRAFSGVDCIRVVGNGRVR